MALLGVSGVLFLDELLLSGTLFSVELTEALFFDELFGALSLALPELSVDEALELLFDEALELLSDEALELFSDELFEPDSETTLEELLSEACGSLAAHPVSIIAASTAAMIFFTFI